MVIFCEPGIFWFSRNTWENILGLKIINNEGERISFKQANQRYSSKLWSSLMFYLGFLPIFSKQKQTLHDKMSRTFVVKKVMSKARGD